MLFSLRLTPNVIHILMYIRIILYFGKIYFQYHIRTCKCNWWKIKNLICLYMWMDAWRLSDFCVFDRVRVCVLFVCTRAYVCMLVLVSGWKSYWNAGWCTCICPIQVIRWFRLPLHCVGLTSLLPCLRTHTTQLIDLTLLIRVLPLDVFYLYIDK